MNVERIEKLSRQINSLDTFHKRCLWPDAVFSVSGHSLDMGTSGLIKREIHEVIDKEIGLLEAKIKREAISG